ncbi:hypothetical protein ON010_g18331 [Phytophthora cinnamomi]|nr:hypothetical protein ON010_g18331 [Phytophthora cinnamomi]
MTIRSRDTTQPGVHAFCVSCRCRFKRRVLGLLETSVSMGPGPGPGSAVLGAAQCAGLAVLILSRHVAQSKSTKFATTVAITVFGCTPHGRWQCHDKQQRMSHGLMTTTPHFRFCRHEVNTISLPPPDKGIPKKSKSPRRERLDVRPQASTKHALDPKMNRDDRPPAREFA